MNFLRRVFSREPSSACPYCSVELEPRPTRKKKCPECGHAIFVRKGELLTEEQAAIQDWLKRLEGFGVDHNDFEKER